ncbi:MULTISPECIES: DUF4435 domain-containing protein [Paenibacillus]|uniref:DUF4435 domain-containing protein n=1 Tax=Paenibacillus TaxID=44249 RepID=UPI002DBA6155|nr:hypothetical protein [Paenibacillus odorifer]MEC0129517.1 hypothetical protein [Paenibacillus odorifer]MEC0221118.1 hypothetical protein [Paenibacillus odorifer]
MNRTDDIDYQYDVSEFEIHLLTKKKIILLEGNSDLKFLKILLNKTEPNSIIPYCINGNNSKTQLISLFNDFPHIQNNNLYLGIVDKDLDDLTVSFSNLIYTDFPDLDCYYLHFSGFRNFVNEYFDNIKTSETLGFNPVHNIPKFINFIITAIDPLTILRLISKSNAYNIPLGKVFVKSPVNERRDRHKKFKKIINDNNIICKDKLFTYLMSSPHCDNTILNAAKHTCEDFKESNLTYQTNGHDLISFITYLYNLTNNIKKDDVEIEESLRLTIHIDMFNEYPNIQKVSNWILPFKGAAFDQVAVG